MQHFALIVCEIEVIVISSVTQKEYLEAEILQEAPKELCLVELNPQSKHMNAELPKTYNAHNGERSSIIQS